MGGNYNNLHSLYILFCKVIPTFFAGVHHNSRCWNSGAFNKLISFFKILNFLLLFYNTVDLQVCPLEGNQLEYAVLHVACGLEIYRRIVESEERWLSHLVKQFVERDCFRNGFGMGVLRNAIEELGQEVGQEGDSSRAGLCSEFVDLPYNNDIGRDLLKEAVKELESFELPARAKTSLSSDINMVISKPVKSVLQEEGCPKTRYRRESASSQSQSQRERFSSTPVHSNHHYQSDVMDERTLYSETVNKVWKCHLIFLSKYGLFL